MTEKITWRSPQICWVIGSGLVSEVGIGRGLPGSPRGSVIVPHLKRVQATAPPSHCAAATWVVKNYIRHRSHTGNSSTPNYLQNFFLPKPVRYVSKNALEQYRYLTYRYLPMFPKKYKWRLFFEFLYYGLWQGDRRIGIRTQDPAVQ